MIMLAETPFADKIEPLSNEACMPLFDQVPNWQLAIVNNIQQLERTFSFVDFKEALVFTNRIAMLAEEVNHHPTLVTEWGRVTIRWWTHSLKGVHLNDFICAAKTDQLFEKQQNQHYLEVI